MRRLRLAALFFLVICPSLHTLSQPKAPGQKSDPFEDFFQNNAAVFDSKTYDTAFSESRRFARGNTPAEIKNVISVIDAQLDNAATPVDVLRRKHMPATC